MRRRCTATVAFLVVALWAAGPVCAAQAAAPDDDFGDGAVSNAAKISTDQKPSPAQGSTKPAGGELTTSRLDFAKEQTEKIATPSHEGRTESPNMPVSVAVEHNLEFTTKPENRPATKDMGIPEESIPARERIKMNLQSGDKKELKSAINDAHKQFPDDPTFHALALLVDDHVTQAQMDKMVARVMAEGTKLFGIQVDVQETPTKRKDDGTFRGTFPASMKSLGQAYSAIDRNDPAGAMKVLDRAIARDPNNGLLYDARTLARLNAGDAAGADADSLMAIKLNPSGTDAYTHRAQLMRELGRLQESSSWAEHALEVDPEDDTALMIRGKYFWQTGKRAAALLDFRKASQIDPAHYQFYRDAITNINAGNLTHAARQLSERDYAGALKEVDAAIAANPQDLKARELRGLVLVKAKRYGEAIKESNVALKLNPRDARALMNRAMALEALGSIPRAQADYKLAYDIDPTLRKKS